MSRQRTPAVICLLLALFASAALPAAAAAGYTKEQRQAVAEAPAKYRAWLEEVELIIHPEELEAFLVLEEDYQRDAFIKRFWRVRDPYPDTARNEFQEAYEQRVAMARGSFGGLETDRARTLLLNGAPHGRLETRCSLLRPLDIWFYQSSPQVHYQFVLIFFREGSIYRLWRPFDGLDRLVDRLMAAGRGTADGDLLRRVRYECPDGDTIATAFAHVLKEGPFGYEQTLSRIEETPKLGQSEWVATFASYTTDLPPDAKTLPAELHLAFPGRYQSRTVLQGTVAVPRQAASTAELAGSSSHNFVLIGEVLLDGELFDSFRYRFDLPAEATRASTTDSIAAAATTVDGDEPDVSGNGASPDLLPIVFRRYLRPGDYRLVVRVEDLNGGAFFRAERELAVPEVEGVVPPPAPDDPETARILAEANAVLAAGGTVLQIVPPVEAIHTGYVRFDTLASGDRIERVAFALDGDVVLTKTRPPFSVELDLGPVPHSRTLEAFALDSAGEELARDEILINAGGNRFAVDLVEPRRGRSYRDSLTVEAKVEAPEGKTVERVEVFWNETRLATLYQEPWTQPVVLPGSDEIAYVRVVAYLTDGNSTEDLVFVNAPDYLEEVDVQFVELYASALDRRGRPVDGLGRDAFTVLEGGVPQQVARFETVRDLPIHVAALVDVSASMADRLDQTRQAALGFFEAAIGSKDRAAVITFNDHPHLAVKFTNELRELGGGLAGLDAGRGTSLYDAVIFGLYHFNGVKGQRAMLVLSDGKDESSRFSWEQTLEYARRAGVTIYTIALADDAAHKRLTTLAEATGGRSFLVPTAEGLAAVYRDIQEELRSKYLIAYQSSDTSGKKDFRRVEVRSNQPGVEIKTMQGYYP